MHVAVNLALFLNVVVSVRFSKRYRERHAHLIRDEGKIWCFQLFWQHYITYPDVGVRREKKFFSVETSFQHRNPPIIPNPHFIHFTVFLYFYLYYSVFENSILVSILQRKYMSNITSNQHTLLQRSENSFAKQNVFKSTTNTSYLLRTYKTSCISCIFGVQP